MIKKITLIIALLLNLGVNAQTTKKKVFVFDIKEMIAPPVWRMTQKAMKDAEAQKADLILIHMNTYGGLVDMADSMRTKILNSPIPVFVFIDNNAASAGALISIACDSIYMRKSASIGAATVVSQDGAAMPDKYQSYMRSTMRATAESTGRDPKIAEGMVDPSVYIPGITDSGKVITFTSTEAIKYGFANGIAESIPEVLKLAGIEDYELVYQEVRFVDNIIGFLLSPAISGILILIIIGGIYFELQTPGVGFPLAASVLAAIFYFAPLYLEGLAANWEILVFVVGLILIGVEIFVIPGFGIAGISGIALAIIGLTLSLLENNNFDFSPVSGTRGAEALLTVLLPVLILVMVFIFLGDKLFSSGAFKRIVLSSEMNSEAGYTVGNTYNSLIGAQGVAITDFKPFGKIEINDETYDARLNHGFAERGTTLQVVATERNELIVKKLLI